MMYHCTVLGLSWTSSSLGVRNIIDVSKICLSQTSDPNPNRNPTPRLKAAIHMARSLQMPLQAFVSVSRHTKTCRTMAGIATASAFCGECGSSLFSCPPPNSNLLLHSTTTLLPSIYLSKFCLSNSTFV